MAKLGIELRINLDKIEQAKVYKGDKGSYLTATAFIDTQQLGQYGTDHGMISQKATKEEQEAKKYGATLGNATVFWTDDNSHVKVERGGESSGGGQTANASFDNEADSIPF